MFIPCPRCGAATESMDGGWSVYCSKVGNGCDYISIMGKPLLRAAPLEPKPKPEENNKPPQEKD